MIKHNRGEEKNAKTITSRLPNISLPLAVKQELDRLKILPEEPYWKVIKRIINNQKEVKP